METTLNNIQPIYFALNPHQATNFRNASQEILITSALKINSNINEDLHNKNNKIVNI